MRTVRLAPLLLALLAACTVDTDSLKPRSEAECTALHAKVCGNRCMPITVANGCGNPGCTPCPAVPEGYESFCDGSSPPQCASRGPCPEGQRYCDGPTDTVCDDIVSTSGNCGACGHYCGSGTCANYLCSTTTIQGASANPPQDITYDGSNLYWTVLNSPAAGLVQLFEAGAARMSWTGRQNRIEADGDGVVLWSTSAGEAIQEVRGGDTSPTRLFTPASAVRSVALDRTWAYFTEAGSASAAGQTASDLVQVHRSPAADTANFLHYAFSGASGLAAVAIENPLGEDNAVVGTDNGALRWVSFNGDKNGTYATAVEPPVAMVVYYGLVGPGATANEKVLFWLSAGGHLWGKILPDGGVVRLTPAAWTLPSNAGPGGLDLFADAAGVYWVDSGFQGGNLGVTYAGTYGVVGEWRAAQDDVVILYLSNTGRPSRVAANSDSVVWIDGQNGAVISVPK